MGRRGANQTAVFFAALGTLACGLSSNMNMLIAARFVRLKPAGSQCNNFLTVLISLEVLEAAEFS
jgi:MFS family permease